ncbi:MAG TPA: sugar transferase [Gemmatimonadaceae bacterium]|nr:sugar transferase [Gemmatimonadaceae bacterium]
MIQRRTEPSVLSLPAYDIRIRRELAQRRLIRALVRHATRVLVLHVLDAAVIAAAVLIAAWMLPIGDAEHVTLPLVGLLLLALNLRGAYGSMHRRRDAWQVLSAIAGAVGALIILRALPHGSELSAGFIVAFGVIVALGLVAERWMADVAVRQAHAHGVGLRKALILGRRADVQTMVAALERDRHRDHHVLGFVTSNQIVDDGALGTIAEIESVLDRADPAELIVSGTLAVDSLKRVVTACLKRGITILAVPVWSRAMRGWAEPVNVGGLPGYQVHPARLGMPALMLKRAVDLLIASAALVICAPLMLLVAVAVKLDSPGPVFYRQRRVGLGGREFMMWKFRSMQIEAERRLDQVAHLNRYTDGRLFKLAHDPRITRVGRLLRRFSLDELPQLFNVLAGDMSLVGPRPPLPTEVGKYEPRHFVRLSVVPGITGPWQVGGRNLITDFEEVVRLERAYVDSWSMRLDLAIMAKTFGVVLSGKGAY